MPYIQTRTNISIPKDREENIKKKLGEVASIIGKSESYLMTEFVENCDLYFRGVNTEPIAFVDVKLYGSSDKYEEMTEAITEITNSELGIDPKNIYVSYAEYKDWGNNGHNF